jgi:hypothetical protein
MLRPITFLDDVGRQEEALIEIAPQLTASR